MQAVPCRSHIRRRGRSNTHIGRFSEGFELLLFEREPAEGQRRVLVVLQMGLDLLNLLITLGYETERETGVRGGGTPYTRDVNHWRGEGKRKRERSAV